MNRDDSSQGLATSNRPLTGRGGDERLPANNKAARAWASLSEALAKRARLWKRKLGKSHYQKRLARIFMAVVAVVLLKVLLLDSKPATPPGEIEHPALLERLAFNAPLLSTSHLDTRKHDFLRSRIGRDERPDLFIGDIKAGMKDFWDRFQLPFATNANTMNLDEQVIRTVVDDLMSFNGWQAATCSSLIRPFGSHKKSHQDDFADLSSKGELYYFALVVHSADMFMIDQLAVVIQMARRLGPTNVFVSLLDYGSTDATPFLCDLTEMVLTLLSIPFRIRRIPPMTVDPAAAYYPQEEAYTRNLALEPLMEFYHRRHVRFARVIWLKGFACPTDILESLRLSTHNHAAMTCSMDWKEHNKNYVFNDRWRSRDLDGNLFLGSKSTASLEDAPPMEAEARRRFGNHEPFQVFCCESGVHIVDPSQSYYQGISYRSSIDYGIFNVTDPNEEQTAPKWSEGPCMDSAQMHFCRDLWLLSARQGVDRVSQEAEKKAGAGDQDRGLSAEWEALLKRVKPLKAFEAKASASDSTEGWFAETDPDHQPDGDDEGDEAQEEDEKSDPAHQEEMAAADAAAAGVADGQGKVADIDQLKAQWAAADAAEAQDQEQAVNAKALDDEEMEARDEQKEQEDVGDSENKGEDAETEEAKNDKRRLRKRAADSESSPEETDSGKANNNSSRKAAPKGLANTAFDPARILVNPHCITTYAGVSHTQLALDLFGKSEDEEHDEIGTSPVHKHGSLLEDSDWRSAPETFVCQEMRTTGGRVAPKQQRRSGFYIAKALQEGWHPNDDRKR